MSTTNLRIVFSVDSVVTLYNADTNDIFGMSITVGTLDPTGLIIDPITNLVTAPGGSGNLAELTSGCYNVVEVVNNSGATIGSSGFILTVLPSGDLVHVIEAEGLTDGNTVSGLQYGIKYMAGLTDNNWFEGLCCVHEDTILKTNTGPRLMKYIEAGDIVYNQEGEEVQVLYNIKHAIPAYNFVKVNRHSFGKNIPDRDLYITEGHPIMLWGKECKCEDLIDGENVTKVATAKAHVYTLCTEEKEWIMTQNLPVATYAHKDWKQFSKENHRGWWKQ